MKKKLFIIQYDTFANTLIPVIEELYKRGHECDIVLLKRSFYKKNWISDHILNLFKIIKKNINIFQILNRRNTLKLIKKNKYNTIIIGTTRTRFIEKIYNYLKNNNLKSKLVSGYVGALLNNNYLGFIKGLKRRSFCDLIWTPGIISKKKIESLKIINEDKTKIVATGLPRFDELFKISNSIKLNDKKNILFFEQPTFPQTKKERQELVLKLIKLAKINQDCDVIIKPRFSQKIGHAHSPKYLLQDILLSIEDKPKNIKISNQGIYKLFEECKLALTISSTAGLESLLIQIPTLFINDFCGDNNKYGSHDFKNINATITFNDLFKKNIPTINYEIVNEIIRFDGQNTNRLTEEIILLDNKNE